ncbi:protein cordon-bleu [Pelobates fuscus]|uniref:protein cordon-bleu n=1 Tax=Pelobates fuscus TaxID=191477 RepID=UPI002FE46C8E
MEVIVKPPTGKKMKARAPPPPFQRTTSKELLKQRTSSDSDGTGNQCTEDKKENILQRKVDLTICFPDAEEKSVAVNGSKAVMDLLVEICSQYHLNPAHHSLEMKCGTSQQSSTLKPNTLIGTLDAQTLYLKEKVPEVKIKKPPPRVPEKTVRLVVNFLGNQKAVVRVNPTLPLRSIYPVICEKCEFKHEYVTLLKDATSKEELDMSKSLNDLDLKELYVWNSKQEKGLNLSTSSDTIEKEKKGILGFFRNHKKNSKHVESMVSMDSNDYEDVFKTKNTSGSSYEGFSTVPSSPSVNSRPIAMGASLSLTNISGLDVRPEVKKRRAPPPPPNVTAQEMVTVKTSDEKQPEQLYATIQRDHQKIKRRAPLPPSPQMPNEINEEKENRKSTTVYCCASFPSHTKQS